MLDARKAVWSIPYVSVASFFPSVKQNFIAYWSSKVYSRPDCIFEIHQLWQWGFSRVYSNCCCSCSFEPETITIGQSSHSMYRNNIVNFQESTTILNAHTKKVWKHIVCTSYLFGFSRDVFSSLDSFGIVMFPSFWSGFILINFILSLSFCVKIDARFHSILVFSLFKGFFSGIFFMTYLSTDFSYLMLRKSAFL